MTYRTEQGERIDALLQYPGTQVKLSLRNGAVIFGEVVQPLLSDSVTILPWGCLEPMRIDRAAIGTAMVAEVETRSEWAKIVARQREELERPPPAPEQSESEEDRGDLVCGVRAVVRGVGEVIGDELPASPGRTLLSVWGCGRTIAVRREDVESSEPVSMTREQMLRVATKQRARWPAGATMRKRVVR